MRYLVKFVVALIVIGVSVMVGIWLWQRAQEEGLTDGVGEITDVLRGNVSTSTTTAGETPAAVPAESSETVRRPLPAPILSQTEQQPVPGSPAALQAAVWDCLIDQQDIANRIVSAGNPTAEDSWSKTKAALIAEAPNMVIAIELCWVEISEFPEARRCAEQNTLVSQFYRDLPQEISDNGADWLLSNTHIENSYLACLETLL